MIILDQLQHFEKRRVEREKKVGCEWRMNGIMQVE
jgi:hypothetical protein